MNIIYLCCYIFRKRRKPPRSRGSLPPHKPLTSAHPLHYQHLHAYHHAACGCDDSRFARHEAIAATLAACLKPEGPFRVDLKKRLGSSLSTQTKIDLNLTCYAFQPPTTSFDITVSCPLLPAYHKAATLSSSTIFDTRHAEKAAAHLHGLTAQGRAYHTLCLTTLNGIGPDPVLAYIDRGTPLPAAGVLAGVPEFDQMSLPLPYADTRSV